MTSPYHTPYSIYDPINLPNITPPPAVAKIQRSVKIFEGVWDRPDAREAQCAIEKIGVQPWALGM